ncbi:MAG: hypothetical protein WBF53_12925, partial [Litorimonas sp.]
MPIRPLLISLTFAAIASAAFAQAPRVSTGSGDRAMSVADGFAAEVYARRLGDVSDMARHPDGTLFVADRAAGRIFRIQDRRMDGRADTTQALPQRFDT